MRRLQVVIWLLACPAALCAQFELRQPDTDVVGSLKQVSADYDDTFVGLGRVHGLGYEELTAANPQVDPWVPGVDQTVLLPGLFVLPDTPRQGIVLNLAEMRLYFYPTLDRGANVVQTYPVSVGRIDADTPVGSTTVVDKVHKPVWFPPASIIAEHAERGEELARSVPPGPDNPLGDYAMQLGIPGYLIHGTNRPAGIGMRVTHGCIRMQPGDIETLFRQVPRKTPVHIVNQPYKMGWIGDTLFLEVHRPFADDTTHVERGLTAIVELYVRRTVDRPFDVDWDAVDLAYEQALGIPVPLQRGLPADPYQRITAWCSRNAAADVCSASSIKNAASE